MAKYLIEDTTLTNIADAIRAKKGTTAPVAVINFASEISAIEGGGSTDGGECTGRHVIEVDTLPTENIDTNALYRCGGKYYEYGLPKLTAIYVYMFTSFVDYKMFMTELGIPPENISYNTLPTQTNEGVLESVFEGDNVELKYHAYYIIDRDDVFVFLNGQWVSLSDPSVGSTIHYGGVISDISEATDTEAYYVMLEGSGWIEYSPTPEQFDLETDFIVENPEEIEFTIKGTTYNAAYGMTWGEWCDSIYNTDGYYIESKMDYLMDNENYVIVLNGVHQASDTIIQHDMAYGRIG